jgi:hypothetical protein
MGQLDAWSQRALQRREGRMEFLGEQSGSVEDTLKRDLILEFVTRPPIRRAYLATVAAGPDRPPASAVCVLSDLGDDRSLVVRVGEILRRRFGADAMPDVLFLTAEQDRDVARVCAPFYVRPAG